MDPRTVIDNEFLTLTFHPGHKIVHHAFKRSTEGSPLREMFLAGLDLIEKEGADKWLSDDRNFPIWISDDAIWARKEWEPKALAAGWRFWAVVMPLRVMARMNLDDIIARSAEKGLIVRSFEDPEEAYAWLKGC